MNVKIELVKKENAIILERLLQLYLHDATTYFSINLEEDGTYDYGKLDKYFDGNNYPYFIKYNDHLAGFALIDKIDNNYIVQEMFVANNYKGLGIGTKAISQIFDNHKGNWIIKVLPNSIRAENFWTKTIKEYTNDKYSVEHVGKYNRAEFYFNNKE